MIDDLSLPFEYRVKDVVFSMVVPLIVSVHDMLDLYRSSRGQSRSETLMLSDSGSCILSDPSSFIQSASVENHVQS